MVGKNNTQERFRRNATKDKRYTLKKLSVGLASVALGTVLFLNGAETVSAETEVSEPNETTDALSEVEQVTQPVQSTFQFSYVRNGGQIDGFTGDYANAHEAEKAFRHHANQHGYTLLNIRLEGNTFIADVQADNSTFQFNYLNEATGEKLDSFFGDYLNASEAEKDFRNYANEHGYTLSNVRLEGNTFTADVAVAEESQPAESTFQFIYRNKETGKKLDGFFGDYSNASEAEKDFRNYANQHGYTLSNIRKNGQTFTADVVRQEQSETTDSDRYVEAAKQRARQLINALDNLTAEQKADYLAQVEAAESVAQVKAVYDEAKNVVNAVEKDYSYTLNFGDRTESANLGEFDSEEQAELALRILTNEKGYKLSNLRLEGRTFIADAKVEAEQDQSSEQTNRYLQEAKKRAYGIINGLENLFDTQKPSYLERIEDADSVAAVEAIVEEAQNYVNESKGGENGQAAEEPERPEYNPEQNLVTYDIQITDHNGKTQTQRVTFPSRELALNYISQLVRSYEKAGVVLNEERSDVEGRDNTFILVFEKKQAEQKPDEKPELDVPTPNENAPAPEKLDTAKAEALAAIAGLKYLSAKEKEELVELINEADNLTEVNYLVGAAYKLNINKFPGKVPAPEELDVAKAEALDAIAGLEYLSEEEKAGFVERINETVELGEVNRLVGLAFKRNIENFPEKTPEQDPEEEAGRELDAAKAGALEDIANLDYFTTTEKQDLVDRVNEYDNIGDIDFVVSKAIEENDRRHLEYNAELVAYKEAAKNALKAQGFDNELVFGLIDKATTKEGVDALAKNIKIEDLNKLNEEFGRLEQKAEKLNNELEALINEVKEKEEVAQKDLDAIVNKVNEIRGNLDMMQKHINILPEGEREKEQAELNQVRALLDQIEKQYSYEDQSLQYLKDQVTKDLLLLGAPSDLITEIQQAPSAQVVRQLAGEFERQKEITEKNRALKAYKEAAKNALKAQGFDNELVFGLIDKATTKEGVDALAKNIKIEDLNKLNEEFGRLEQKAEKLNNELEALINEVKEKEEVAQKDLDAIVNKVNEIRGNLDMMQKHINILPEGEREKEQAELNQVRALLDQIEKQYSYEDQSLQHLKDQVTKDLLLLGAPSDLITEIQQAPSAQVVRQLAGEFERQKEITEKNRALKAYKEAAKNALKAQGFDNELVFGLIDKATTKEGVDALAKNIKIEDLNKLNEEFGRLEQKAEKLNNELEALINEVKEKEEVAQKDLDAIVNKVNEIRGNLDMMQKHINILPGGEREKEQAELNQVRALLDQIEKQYSYEDQSLQHLKDQVTKDLLLLGAPSDLITEIQQAPSAQVVRQLAGEFEKAKILKRKNSLATQIESKVTHDGQKAKLLGELKRVKVFSELEALEVKVDRQIEVDKKRTEVAEIITKWDKIYSNLKEDSEGNKFTTEAEHSELSKLTNQYNQLLPEWEELAQGDYTNESGVEVLKNLVKDKFEIIPPVINIGELGDSVELKIKELVSDSSEKDSFKKKLTNANTVKELQELEKAVDDYLDEQDKTELERERTKVIDEIDQLIDDKLVAEHQVEQQKAIVNDKSTTLEDIYRAVFEIRQTAFNNLKNGTIEDIEKDADLSQDLKNKYISMLEKANSEFDIAKILNLLDIEEIVEKAKKSDKKAQSILTEAQKDGEFSATDQGQVKAENDIVKASKAKAQELLKEFSNQYAAQITVDDELKDSLDNLQKHLENIAEIDVPNISKETLEEFKQDAIEKLKQFVPNLEDKEREVYENIIKKMNG
ncbi:hypothetical protein B8A40_03960, partial [Dolosigranulum pigrum]|uniref:albumin-binding GA domain-containing protein n=1 Tax=Dolosigranulum pigrum TaxID=29394 RepID=UPI000DC2A98F